MSFISELRYAVGSAADRAVDLTLTTTCAGCYLEGVSLCRQCRASLDRDLRADPGGSARGAAALPFPLSKLEWCAAFTGLTRRALDRLGEAGERRLSGPLGEAIAKRWAISGGGGDVLVPVPAGVERLRERGFDEAVLLAQEAGRHLHMPVVKALGRPQATDGEAFEVIAAERIRGRSVVLVDAVVGTGDRLAASANALLRAGARVVSAVTVARDRLAASEQPAQN
jgi:predicted amidophosphoribosyltransferase